MIYEEVTRGLSVITGRIRAKYKQWGGAESVGNMTNHVAVGAWIAAMKISGVDPERARLLELSLRTRRDDTYLVRDLEFLANQPVKTVWDDDDDYPVRTSRALREKKPRLLFCFGEVALFNRPSIFICGSRNVSDKGMELAYKCGRIAADAGYVVASGYARGIDSAAHYGALDAGGKTIAVLPYGLSRFSVRRELAGVFDAESFLAASELPPSYGFTARNALRRNTILASLAEAVIVIEPGDTGGTWYSAEQARALNRPLFFHTGERPEYQDRLTKLGGVPIEMRNGVPSLDSVFSRCGR